ncbi:hypothetical protein glysoja_021037 [Glycine soja]|nr:hypothetical protein glysoja_021037 [Glycine soja]
MPSPKSSRSGQIESHRRGRSSSFHGQGVMSVSQLRRPKTVSDLPSIRSLAGTASLDRKEKLLELGSRNFFLCPRKAATTVEGSVTTSFASCAKEAKKERQGCGGGGGGFAWFKLMQFMM